MVVVIVDLLSMACEPDVDEGSRYRGDDIKLFGDLSGRHGE